MKNPLTQLLTIKDLAELLRVSVRKLYREKAAGKLPKEVRIGKKGVRWDPDDVRDWLNVSKNAKGKR